MTALYRGGPARCEKKASAAFVGEGVGRAGDGIGLGEEFDRTVEVTFIRAAGALCEHSTCGHVCVHRDHAENSALNGKLHGCHPRSVPSVGRLNWVVGVTSDATVNELRLLTCRSASRLAELARSPDGGPDTCRRAELIRTPAEDDGLMVLRFGLSARADLNAAIVCHARRGGDW